MYVLLCIHHSPLAVAEEQGGKCFVPHLFPGDAEGEAGLLPALPLETLKALGVPIIYSMWGKEYLHSLILCITLQLGQPGPQL